MDKLAFAYQDLKQPSRDESWGEGYWAGIDFSKSYFESLLTREREVAREEVVRLAEGMRKPETSGIHTRDRISMSTTEIKLNGNKGYNKALNDLIEKMGGDK